MESYNTNQKVTEVEEEFDAFEFIDWCHDHPARRVQVNGLPLSNSFSALDAADVREEEASLEPEVQEFDPWRTFLVPDEALSSLEWRMRSFRYEGRGNVPFSPTKGEWYICEFWPEDEFCVRCPFATEAEEQWTDVPSGLDDAIAFCTRAYAKYMSVCERRARRRVQEEETALIEEAIREVSIFREGLQCARDVDRVGRKYFPREQCRVRGCVRPVICDVCKSCLKHSAPRKCCGIPPQLKDEAIADRLMEVEVVTKRNKFHSRRSMGPLYRKLYRIERRARSLRKVFEKMAFSGVAQALFNIGIDVENIKHEHVMRVPFVEDFVKVLSDARPDVPWTKFVTEVVFFFLHLMQGGLTMKNLALCLSHLFANVGMSSMKWFWQKLMNRPVAQSVSIESALAVLATAISVLVGAVSLFAFSRLPADAAIDKFIMRFSRIGHCISSASALKGVSSQAAACIVDFLRTQVFGLGSEDLREFERIDAFCDEVQQLNTPDFEEKCTREADALGSRIGTLLQRADEINKMLDALKVPAIQTQRFRASYLFLVKARDTVAAAGVGTLKARIPPLVIHVHGGTGVGKSSMLDFLNSDLLIAMGSKDPEDLHNKVYWRYPTSDFFDGYRNGTLITVCDDFGSAKDSEVRPSPEPLEQIRMTNAAPFRPPMAHLSDKANTVFESKVVIWTSNRAHFSFVSLTNPEAVHNRVHLRFRQYPHPDYAVCKNINGTNSVVLDFAKVVEAAKANPEVHRECMLFDMESTEGAPGANGSYHVVQAGMTYREMSNLCVQKLKERQAGGRSMQAETKTYFTRRMEGQEQAGDDVESRGPDVEAVFAEMYGTYDRQTGVAEGAVARFFHQPGWLARKCGALYHIDVFGTLLATLGPTPQTCVPFVPADEESLVYLNAPCIVTDESNLFDVLTLLVEAHQRRLNGQDPMPLVQRMLPHALHCACLEHDNTQAMMTFTQGCVRSIKDAMLNNTVKAVLGYLAFAEKHPLLSLCITLFGSYLFWKALKALMSWIFSKILGCVVAGASAVIGGAKLLMPEAYGGGVKSAKVVVTEGAYASGVTTAKAGRVEAYPSSSVRTSPTGRVEGVAEAMSDENAGDIRRKVFKNLYQIFTSVDGDRWVGVGSLTFLSGRVGITNRHMYPCLKECVRIVCANGPQTYEFLKTDLNVYSIPDEHEVYGHRDVAIWECPLNVCMHGSLTKFFMNSEDFSRHEELRKVCLVTYQQVGAQSVPIYKETDRCRAFHREEFQLLAHGSETRKIRNFYCYGLETQAGDCGGLLIAFDPRFNRKIVGIHMAGGAIGQGFTAAGVAVPHEMLEELIGGLKLRWTHSLLDADVSVDNPIDVQAENGTLRFANPIEGNFAFVGKADSKVYSSKQTAISSSPIAEFCGPILKKPAYLCAGFNQRGERIDPVRKALNKACTPSVLVDRKALAAAVNDVKQMICNSDVENASALTFEEAYRGKPGNLLYPAINRSTSPGYGWKKFGKGKTFYLGSDDFVVHPDLKAEYDACLQRLRSGERLGKYWTDTMKDELRPIEKVEDGKTRLFSAGEMVLTILLRQFYMGFSAHMTKNMIDFEACVGINAYSLDWTALATRLQRHGKNVVAGDFANYDGTLPADVLWEVLGIVNSFYNQSETEEEASTNNKIRSLLWLEIVNSVHINGDIVYTWSHSQPSGCPFTSILNSVVHSIIVRVAYILAARKYCPEKANLSFFRKGVAHANYGDDDVTNVSGELSWFNQISMAEAYATFGMTYTDETKTGQLVEFKTLEEIQFLKRSFVWDEEQARYRAPLDINTIKEMPCWQKTKGDSWELAALVLEDAVYELAQHPKSVWEEVMPRFERARLCVNARRPLRFSSYEEIAEDDALKYMAPRAISVSEPEFMKLRDRGFASITVRSEAANPAEVVVRPPGTTVRSVGGLFSPIGQCVPTIKSKLLARYALLWPESAAEASIRLPTTSIRQRFRDELTEDQQAQYRPWLESQKNLPTMCRSSWDYQEPRIAVVYTPIAECPCDFHGLADTDKFRSLMEQFVNSQLNLTGDTQAGNPDFAGGEDQVVKEEVMTFEEDGTVGVQDRQMDAPVPAAVRAGGEDFLTNDVVAFLRRPVHIKDFVWTASQPPLENMFSLDLPKDWLNIPMIKEKVAGFRYVRGTLVLRMQINAQPMNAGALILYLEPLRMQCQYAPSSGAHLGGITGYPNVQYRCGEETTVEFRLPFFPLVSHFDLVTGYGTIGRVNCLVMSQLTGSLDCDGAVFIHMEDPVVDMPTGASLALTGMAQAGGLAKERERPGNVETAAKTLGGVAKALSGVPMIGAAATIADTVLSGVGSVASFFGWSKPLDPEYTTTVSPCMGRQMANHNGDSKAKVLALDAKNVCDVPTSVFNTTEDEMAFNTLLKKEIFADRFTYSGEQLQGQLIYKWPVEPGACVKSLQTQTLPPARWIQRQETMLSYLSTCAMFWRGEIKFRFKLIKTSFHSGRLRVTYVPGAHLGTDFTTVQQEKCYSKVYDIRERADIEFSVPYNYFQPWKATEQELNRPTTGTAWQDLVYTRPQGMVYVSIVNALRNPSTVEAHIDILNFISAGEDFQFAVPFANPNVKVVSAATYVGPVAFSGVAQSRLFETATVDESVNANTIGEVFTGFRQWLKRYHDFNAVTEDISKPFRVNYNAAPPPISYDNSTNFGAFHRAMALYRFQSGPMRILAVNREKIGFTAISFSGAVTDEVAESINSGQAASENTYLEPLVELEVPFYQMWPALLTDLGGPHVSLGPPSDLSVEDFVNLPYNFGTNLNLVADEDPEEHLSFYRAIGETFSYGFALGPPVTFSSYGPITRQRWGVDELDYQGEISTDGEMVTRV